MLVENANDARLIWSKLRTNSPEHSNIPDAPSHTQPLLGVAPYCLAAVGSGEEYCKFLLVPKNKYIKLPGSTNTELKHYIQGGKKKKEKKILKKAADHLNRLGECQRGYLQQNQKLSPASPSLQHSPKERVAAAEARTCCRYQKLLTAPKAAVCRRPIFGFDAVCTHRCQG